MDPPQPVIIPPDGPLDPEGPDPPNGTLQVKVPEAPAELSMWPVCEKYSPVGVKTTMKNDSTAPALTDALSVIETTVFGAPEVGRTVTEFTESA